MRTTTRDRVRDRTRSSVRTPTATLGRTGPTSRRKSDGHGRVVAPVPPRSRRASWWRPRSTRRPPFSVRARRHTRASRHTGAGTASTTRARRRHWRPRIRPRTGAGSCRKAPPARCRAGTRTRARGTCRSKTRARAATAVRGETAIATTAAVGSRKFRQAKPPYGDRRPAFRPPRQPRPRVGDASW